MFDFLGCKKPFVPAMKRHDLSLRQSDFKVQSTTAGSHDFWHDDFIMTTTSNIIVFQHADDDKYSPTAFRK